MNIALKLISNLRNTAINIFDIVNFMPAGFKWNKQLKLIMGKPQPTINLSKTESIISFVNAQGRRTTGKWTVASKNHNEAENAERFDLNCSKQNSYGKMFWFSRCNHFTSRDLRQLLQISNFNLSQILSI